MYNLHAAVSKFLVKTKGWLNRPNGVVCLYPKAHRFKYRGLMLITWLHPPPKNVCAADKQPQNHLSTSFYKQTSSNSYPSPSQKYQPKKNLQISQKTLPNIFLFALTFCCQGRSFFCVAMSALVDIWSNELGKLREKGQTLFSSDSSPISAESTQVVGSQEKSSTEVARAFVGRVMRVSSTLVPCSEGSVSMLVQCFSPWRRRSITRLYFVLCVCFLFTDHYKNPLCKDVIYEILLGSWSEQVKRT